MFRWPCKDYLKGTCTNSFCGKRHPPECLFYKTKSGCRFGEKCSYAHRQVDDQSSNRSEKNDDRSAIVMFKKNDWHENVGYPVVNRVKSHERSGRSDIKRDTCHELKQGPVGVRSSNARQLDCVFQDMKSSKSILRKDSDMQQPIQRVKFTKVVARHAKIRHQNPSFGYICPDEPHQRSPNAPKVEDRSQEETELQEQEVREAAWKLAKNVLKLKEQERATFFSFSENRCLSASTLTLGEREFVVDSEASIHIIREKDLNSAEMDTLTNSCSPAIVILINGEVQTKKQTAVNVKELELENTSAVLSLGKLLRWKRIFLWMDQRSKITSHQKRDSDTMQHGELRSYRGSRLVNEFFLRFSSFNFNDTFKTGKTFFYIFFNIVFFFNDMNIKCKWDSRKKRTKVKLIHLQLLFQIQ